MYSKYYEQHRADRNDLLSNPEVTFQAFAFDRANIQALRKLDVDRESARVLDVGCGRGSGLLQLLRLGFTQSAMSGVDISPERIAEAKLTLPAADLRCESAASMTYSDGEFDIVAEFTMFVLLPGDQIAREIAREMIRVTRPGGYLLLADWRYSRPGSDVYQAMSSRRIADLFAVGRSTRVVTRERGALVPPLGRMLSRRAPLLYFAVQALFPPAVGQVTTVLKKIG